MVVRILHVSSEIFGDVRKLVTIDIQKYLAVSLKVRTDDLFTSRK